MFLFTRFLALVGELRSHGLAVFGRGARPRSDGVVGDVHVVRKWEGVKAFDGPVFTVRKLGVHALGARHLPSAKLPGVHVTPIGTTKKVNEISKPF